MGMSRRLATVARRLDFGKASMGIEARRMSWQDTLRLQLFVAAPAFLWGLVAPNRSFVSWLCKRDAGRYTIRFLSELRNRYRCNHLWTWFPLGRTGLVRTILVLDASGIDEVLASDSNNADPTLKKLPLSRFVPDALVISSGTERSDRRSFNEHALDLDRPLRHRDAFRDIVFREAKPLTGRSGDLRWTDFEALGERISHQVILGEGQVRPEITAHLARLVPRSNVFLRDRRSFSAFYEQIEQDLARQPTAAHCLIADRGGGASTQVPAQVGFWFFVLKDAVQLHVARTLALIAAHPEAQERARQEVRRAQDLSAEAIDAQLGFLDACIREQLRLWTPVPILLRRAVKRFTVGGATIEAGQQILIHAAFYHRDVQVFGERADRFSPDSVCAQPAVYFFSAHRQSCAGRTLAMFVVKATLAALLVGSRFELVGPRIEPNHVPYLYDHFKVMLRSSPDT